MPWDDMKMKELALEDRVVAIGEVGLDFYRFPDDASLRDRYIEEQYRVFTAAIKLAKSLEKPLVVHSRQAYDELIEVLEKEYLPTEDEDKLHGTVHCFMGNWSQAQRLLKLGFMLGFTGVITYADIDPALLEVVENIPLNRALIETDAPYLTPEPYRTAGKKETGKLPRNIPPYSREVAKKIGELQHTDSQEIVRLTEENAVRLFRIKDYIYA
jgi:TatD DNase family protein